MSNFKFEGKNYQLEESDCESNFIQLPDNRILEASGWLAGIPPQPVGLILVDGEEVNRKAIPAILLS